MDTVSPAPAARTAADPTPLVARPLTEGEWSHLERLRGWLREDGTDAHDAAALDARWVALLGTHPADGPAPAGVVAALGVAVGDLLAASVTDVLWTMCPGPEGATPGVLPADRPHMPVLPVLDAHARWRQRSDAWVVDYVARASAHLAPVAAVPAPHASPEADGATPAAPAAGDDAVAPAAPPAGDDPVAPATPPVDVALPPADVDAWPHDPADEPWTPVFALEDLPDRSADDAPSAPDAVASVPAPAGDAPSDDAPPAPDLPWVPTFAQDAPHAPTAVADAAPPAPADLAYVPTFAQDAPTRLAARGHDAPTATDGPGAAASRSADDLAAPLTAPTPSTWSPVGYAPGVAPTVPAAPVAVVEPVVDAPVVDTLVEVVDAVVAPVDALDAPSAAPSLDALPDAPVPASPAPGGADTTTPGRGLPTTSHRPLTPEDLPHRPSAHVQDLALRALELALERAVADTDGTAPFVLLREDHDVEVLEFPRSDAGLAEAREAARRGGWSAAAVAWTSPADATRPYPRVVVDASSAGRPGIRVAHSYTHDAQGSREVGGPEVVGQSAPVL